LRAFAYIQKEIPDAVLTVVGDGSQRSALENLASQLQLQRTNFTGRVEHDEINRQYSACDIYLNASKIDNQPLSILEAFACGLPVVTTDAGGIPDIVTDEITGFLVPIGDYEALAARALKLLTHQEIASTMIESARAECVRYTWTVVCPQWLDLYHSVAKQ
jgi:glycosyltransferase involved in cell wall biosynthesis